MADSATTSEPHTAARTPPSGGAAHAAVLDTAHVGDIVGALGRISQHELPPRRPWTRRLVALLAIMGPGLIVMVGDNDAGGIATYAQGGQNYGASLLWTMPVLVLVLIVAQEMVVRLGAVTGVGHGRLIKERFGRLWAGFSVADLLILNFATLVTEFIGVSLSLSYFGVRPVISVPIAGVGLVAMTVTGSFRRWERFMYLLIVTSLLVFPLALMAHPHWSTVGRDFVVPGVAGGLTSSSVLFIIAIVGTTVAPWQLFFQQSNVVDKRITPRWLNFERTDTIIGAFLTNLAAAAVIVAAAFAFAHTPYAGHFTSALGVARGLAHELGGAAGAIFAVILLDASIIGAAAVTLSISYAVGDVMGAKHSLHRSWRDAKGFYGSFAGVVALSAGVVLIPGAPLGLITEGVQALAGVLLPSAIVFLLLLCNDREVLGPWVNPPWLNALATAIVGVLVVLSVILMVTTVFPSLDVVTVSAVLGGALVVALVAMGLVQLSRRRHRQPVDRSHRDRWTMPALALLAPPVWSGGRRIGMVVLRGYLVLAVVLLVVKTVLVGTAPHG
jgi:NRAMP (natural resistance-associated macrophage protein)-like metal ion transporter